MHDHSRPLPSRRYSHHAPYAFHNGSQTEWRLIHAGRPSQVARSNWKSPIDDTPADQTAARTAGVEASMSGEYATALQVLSHPGIRVSHRASSPVVCVAVMT